MYNFPYQQIVVATQEEDNFAMACWCASGPYANFSLYHGGYPTFDGSLANFKAMLQHFGLGTRTFAAWANYIRTDGGWTITEPNAAFTGNADNYLSQGDYTLQSNSPLKG